MRTGSVVFILITAMAAAAHAVPYNDAATGNWSAAATWGGGGTPGAGDTAVIDSHTVTADVKIAPTITLVDITKTATTNGTLKVTGNTQSSPAASLQLNGGVLQISGSGSNAYNPLVVTADSTIQCLNASWNNPYYLRGALSDGATTGTLTTTGGKIRLYGDGSGFSGNWDVQSLSLEVNGANSLGAGQVTVRSGSYLFVSNDGATDPSLVVVHGRMAVSPNAAWAIQMEDGGIYDLTDYSGVGGTMLVNGGTSYVRCTQNNQTNYYNGTISGTGKLILQATSDGNCGLGLNADNSGYTGAWDIDAQRGNRTVYVSDPNALGTNAGGLVTVKSGSRLGLNTSLARDFTMEDGSAVRATGASATRTLSGTVTLNSGTETLYVGPNGQQTITLNVTGQITGAGQALYSTASSQARCRWVPGNTANDYTGGTALDSALTVRNNYWGDCYVQVTANGQMGQAGTAGAVSVDGIRLWTNPGDANNACLDGLPQINIAGGTLDIQSTETNQIALRETGALRILGGSTAMTYGGAGVFQVYNNAILDKTTVVDATLALPSQAQIIGGNQQVLQGYRANYTATTSFGPGAGIWGGIGTCDQSFSITGTINEATAGRGFTLGAQKGREITIATSATLNATGPINLVGDGSVVVIGTPIANTTGTINKGGLYRLVISNGGGLPGNKVLQVNSGYLDVDHPAALAAGSVTHLNQSGCFTVDQNLTTGTVNVHAGGGIRYSTNTQFATIVPTFDDGAHFVLGGNHITPPAAANGNVHFILTHRDYDDHGNLVLGDNTRLTMCGDYYWSYNDADLRTGEVQTAGTQGRLAAPDGYDLMIYTKVNFPAKTLIVGDPSDFATFSRDGTRYGPISQGGMVYLDNANNVIGTVDIQAGTLQAKDLARLGGATAIHINSGARLYLQSDWSTTWTTGMAFSGGGTVETYYKNGGGGPSTLQLTNSVAPGSSPGTLTMDSHLRLASGAVYEWGLGDGLSDLIDVTGNLTLDSTWILRLVDEGATGSTGDVLLFTYGGTCSLGAYVIDDSLVGLNWDTDHLSIYDDQAGNVYLSGLEVTSPIIPEPAGLSLAGLVLLTLRKRRK